MGKEAKITKYVVPGVSDVLSCFGVPTALVGEIYQEVIGNRERVAVEILLSEIRQGHFENIDHSEVVSVIAKYRRDAVEGVARNNLRLMARVINGMAEKENLQAPTFLKYANVLSSLTEDEIRVLAIMCEDAYRPQMTISDGLQVRPLLQNNPGLSKLKKEVPEYLSIQQALLRTGLLIMSVQADVKQSKRSDVGQHMYRSGNQDPDFDVDIKPYYTFKITPLMCEIMSYVDILVSKEKTDD